MGRFRRLLNDLELKESCLIGRRYTWSNERRQPTLEKIDRWFSTSDWDAVHPDHLLQALSSSISDHCPLLMATNVSLHRKARFHFQSFWLAIPGFHEVVAASWHSLPPKANLFVDLFLRLKATAKARSKWSQSRVGNIKEQILLANELILCFDQALDSRALSGGEAWLRRQLKKKVLGLASLQRTIARQKSRILWLKEGDASERFFKIFASHRRRRNHIFKLKDGGTEASSREGMCALAGGYYANLLGVPMGRRHTLCLPSLGLPEVDTSTLEAPLTEEVRWSTIKSMQPDKAPGPDGFTTRFYQSCWSIIKEVVMKAVRAFDGADGRGMERLNEAFIVLLPKKEGALDIKDFRPISLIHSFAKIVAKAMSAELAPLI